MEASNSLGNETQETENFLYLGENLPASILAQTEKHLCHKNGKFFQTSSHTEARAFIENNRPRTVLVDQYLSSCSGIDFMRWMYNFSSIPAIIVIFENEIYEIESVIALEAGATDAIRTTISARELAARIKACTRKYFYGNSGLSLNEYTSDSTTIPSTSKKPLYFTPQTKRLYFSDSSRTMLHGKEADLLSLLIVKYPSYVNRNEISENIFQREWHPNDRSIDNLISRLRKIVDYSEVNCSDSIIETVRNEGYKLRSPIALLPIDQNTPHADSKQASQPSSYL